MRLSLPKVLSMVKPTKSGSRMRGYRFVTLEEALADPIYAHADTYTRANGISWLHRWTSTGGRPIRWEPEPPKWITDAYAAL